MSDPFTTLPFLFLCPLNKLNLDFEQITFAFHRSAPKHILERINSTHLTFCTTNRLTCNHVYLTFCTTNRLTCNHAIFKTWEFIVYYKVYNIRVQRYRDWNMRVSGRKSSHSFYLFVDISSICLKTVNKAQVLNSFKKIQAMHY